MSQSSLQEPRPAIAAALALIGQTASPAAPVQLDDLRQAMQAAADPARLDTLEPRVRDLCARHTPLAPLAWETQGQWRLFPFNFGNKPDRPIGETFLFTDIAVQVERAAGTFIQYRCSQGDPAIQPQERIDEPVLMLCISGLNAGHALSEIMSFMAYYERLGVPLRVGVSAVVKARLPFIYQLLAQLLPEDRILPLEDGRIYRFAWLALRRNRWFNYVTHWQKLPYEKRDKLMTFGDLREMKHDFADSAARLIERAGEIYAAHAHKYDLSRKIVLIKSSDDPLACSPTRSMYVFPAARALAEAAGFRFVSVSDFADINEYVCTLRHAGQVIISYGSTACTNRFFLDPQASVTLLAHLHYQQEYYWTDNDWHVLHSHTFPVAKQRVILDHPDEIDEAAMQALLDLAAT